MEKAYASAADAIMLDLEDGVPEHAKDEARDAAAEILTETPPKPTYVRVNTMSSRRCHEDVRAVATASLVAIRLPKCEQSSDVREIDSWLKQADTQAGIQVIVESAVGVRRLDNLATSSPLVERISLGESDLLADLGAEFDSPTMDVCRAECVVAARAAGLPAPPQSVFPRVRDTAGLRSSCEKGKRMGFLGRFAIHPIQLPVINDVFTPSDEEVYAAREIVEAARDAEDSDSSVFLLPNNQLVGPPQLIRANAVLALVGDIAVRDTR